MILDAAPGQRLSEFPHLPQVYLLTPPQIEVPQLPEIAQGRDIAELFHSTEVQNCQFGQITQWSNIAHFLAPIQRENRQVGEIFQG